ncbi:MAG: hypothetical protein PSV35_06985 [bacterium]|nr:hypothetical protein [bacterium]
MGEAFYYIQPQKVSPMCLKEIYKPDLGQLGQYSKYQHAVQNSPALINNAKEKLRKNHLYGQYYNNDKAALKLHVSLNEMNKLDVKIIQGLIQLLIHESTSITHNATFTFKIIKPSYSTYSRFSNNDQITIYFDKYSSTADFVSLSNKVMQYLKENNVPDNQQVLGPKESFALNSFVSARFDSNKLLNKYDVYPFFDLELKKFFQQHQAEELDHIPLCALEAVFNWVLITKEIAELPGLPLMGLNEEDSLKVQNELMQMKEDPKKYITKMTPQIPKDNPSIMDTIFSTLDGWNAKVKAISPKTVLEAQNFLQIKELDPKFYALLEVIRKKSVDALLLDPKKMVALKLYQDLALHFYNFKTGTLQYAAFKDNSIDAINSAKPILEKHRGWKEIFINILLIIASLGGSVLYQAISTKGKQVFFKVNTDSMNIVNEVDQALDGMNPKSNNWSK